MLADPLAAVADDVDSAHGSAALEALSAAELAQRLQMLERQMRRCEAAMVAVLDHADRRGVFSIDGHRSIRGWAGATVRWSDAETRDRCRTVALVRDVPDVATELTAGRIGVAQIRELARVRANPRVGDRLVEAATTLIEHAENLPFADFRLVARRWEALNDADGAHRGHEAAHQGRRVSTSQLDDTFHLIAQFGAVQGAAIAEILRRFEHAEFDREWDDLRARVGDDACTSMLERTTAQRRADALFAIFQAAASTPAGAQPPEPVVNIIVDIDTFQAHWAAAASDVAPPPADAADVGRRCETDTGIIVDPADVVAASITGHVRRVVMDRAGVVVEMGRRQRLFTGSARTAAMLQGRRCLWPGCGRDHRTHIDHTTDWQHSGGTSPHNAGPLCPHHNRYKSHGYRVRRDEHGRWHTYHPDGTEIVAA